MEGETLGGGSGDTATTDYSAGNMGEEQVQTHEYDDVEVYNGEEEGEEGETGKAEQEGEDREEGEEEARKKESPKEQKGKQKGLKGTDKEGAAEDLFLTVDGKKFKVRDISHLKQLAQKGIGSEKRFGEAHELRNRAAQMLQLAKQNPRKFLELTGQDPFRFAYTLMNEKISYEEMDENQKKLYDYQQRIKQYEQEREQFESERRAQQRAQREAAAAQELDTKILESFKKSGLPKHKFYVQQIAATMLGAVHRGEDLSVEEATAKVKDRTFKQLSEIASQMDAKAIREWLGPETVKKIMDAEVKRVTDKTAPTVKSAGRPGPPPVQQTKKPKGPLSPREWDEYIEQLKRSG